MQSSPSESQHPKTRLVRKNYQGEVVFIFAYDVAYDMVRRPVSRVLGQPLSKFSLGTDRRNPRHQLFYQTQMATLPTEERLGPLGSIRVERVVKLFPVGAISITYRVPFEVDSLQDLTVFHDLKFNEKSLSEEVRVLAEKIRQELAPYYIRPIENLFEEEAYTVFCLDSHWNTEKLGKVENWFASERRNIAGLLTQEENPHCLSQQEADESTSLYLSYYQNDLAVIDWDAALIVGPIEVFAETLYVMELANLQLTELQAYDRMLDHSLEIGYRDLLRKTFWIRNITLKELRELQIDLARFSDELLNITKFFGDWHLARIYQVTAARFHLSDWHRTIDEKIKTLNDLYQLLKGDLNNRWMLILETAILLLFIIDVVALFTGVR